MSLRVWLPLNGDLHNQGLSDITVANNGATVDNNGKIGKCYSFSNGSSQKITGTFSSPISNAIGSLSCWVKFNSLPSTSGWFCLMQLGASGGFAACRLGVYFEKAAGINISINGSSTGANYKAYSFSTGIWYHICAVYDGTKVKLYINGAEQLNKTASVGSYTTSASTLFIGGTNNYYLNGCINDCRYYDHALSELEIKEIARTKILHYPLNHNGMGNKNLLTNDWNLMAWSKESGISVSWDDTVGMYKILDSSHTSSRWGIYQNITLTANTTYTFSVDGMKKNQNVNFGFAEGTSWPANAGSFTTTVSRLSKTITVGSADANCRIYLNINPVSNGSNYGYFRAPKLEIGSVATLWGSHTDNTIEYDISGYCNNGTKIGTFTYSTDTPKYRVSTYINNGANDYITTSATIGNPADAITMNIWFKSSCTTPGSNYHEIFNHATSVQYFEFAIYKTGYFRQGITINGTRYVKNGGSGLLDGNWHMLTATYDGIAIKRYIDGEIITDMTQSVTGTLNGANAKFLIGHYGSNTSYYAKEAYLSDARIYATALSAQDILSLYHNSALVDEQGIIHGAIH